MVTEGKSSRRKRPTKVTLDAALLLEAKRLGINVSAACERGLAERVSREREAPAE
ncbi:type II toxin-antitoxin system CcdA family antitoxin [Sphingopyxis sp.]|uniref:type II toxin-antitoxin system CcdA family antitoxin n=1 Tax=Sphingopyxis sp. TaxID=1908224 RepID=UPI002624C743|nr:type II toxin-antitoxin system CcdA family antitoxin [Sphingopyxis sp.]MCW0198985.1 type II toxin-antitoxin system CcdA family antitoxin [Sphingopyxis sp.]